MKKYKLTKETKVFLGRTLYRIEALRDFGDVEEGKKGGFVEKEENLSQDNNAWVSGDAEVFGDAWVFGNARVSGKIKCEAGYYFAYKEEGWNITEVHLEDDGILLVKDYQPPKEEKEDDMVELGNGVKVSKQTAREAVKALGERCK
jgi:hypothetical protein